MARFPLQPDGTCDCWVTSYPYKPFNCHPPNKKKSQS